MRVSAGEEIQMHGGPRHGHTYALPVSGADRVQVIEHFVVEGLPYQRIGSYSRVHTIPGTPESNFEFDGYFTALTPVE